MSGLKSNLKLDIVIGRGHFGEVWSATDDVHGQVAVKVLSQQVGETNAEWQLRKDGLLKEGQRLSQASHVNVVRVHQLLEAETNDAIHLVMEYCSGGSLQGPFEKNPLTLSVVRRIFTEVSLGLQALHARGMLHRDIKPSNLLRNANGIVQLGDFGLVTDNVILGYASQAGYADHIAPEVWNGSGTSTRTDIWALGMTIYRLLHGALWYSQSPAPQMVVANGGFARSLHWLPHIPQRWRRVIRKMLNDDPATRHQNAGLVLAAIATLPTEPNWKCRVTPSKVTWERTTAKRKFKVVWTIHSPRKHEWSAWSEPVGPGNRRTVGGSKGILGRAKCERQLEKFFST